ncbi:DsbA family protein [Microtetraspora fusca]|uniref:DsbA family protein n=1 Tax=Microtetraspora fusca TaxID=1997 RepID=A0ABW6VHD6_MICFU
MTTTQNAPLATDVYAEMVRPWCYIGKRPLERALRAVQGGDDVPIVYRPLQFDPGAPRKDTPARRHLGEKRAGLDRERRSADVKNSIGGRTGAAPW